VDEVHPGIERTQDDRVDRRLIEAADHRPHAPLAAKCHGPEAELGDEYARVGKHSISHGVLQSRGASRRVGSTTERITRKLRQEHKACKVKATAKFELT